MDFVLNFFVRLVDLIAFELFEIVVFVAVGVIFLLFLILKVTSHKINGKINALYFTSTMFVLFLYRFAIETNGKQSSNWLLLTAFIFLFALPINCFSKKEKNNENGKEFVKFIDKKIAEQEQRVPLTTNPIEQKVLEDKAETIDGLNLSHVKNILKRLDYFDLSQADRRQVRELETAIFQAERRFDDDDAKEKLNDGLGALLKIMAKYGV